MKEILRYIAKYFRDVNKVVFLLCSLQTFVLVFLNYNSHLEWWLTTRHTLAWPAFTGHYLLFIIAFAFPYALYSFLERENYFSRRRFLVLLVIAPAIFALKMAIHTELPFAGDTAWNAYWNKIYYWPVRLLLIISLLYFVWITGDNDQPFYGLTSRAFKWRPYAMMLLCMVPLVAIASTQADFLAAYPKLQTVVQPGSTTILSWIHKLLFELSYGSDFIGIELFFRGFLILAFIKWVGANAILPMACFYCTIHFGKPLGECVSSYFGGLLLGIVVYNTRSIYGGLIVHLGIAWLMEIGGYVGNGG